MSLNFLGRAWMEVRMAMLALRDQERVGENATSDRRESATPGPAPAVNYAVLRERFMERFSETLAYLAK
jgi:hypothetical protein